MANTFTVPPVWVNVISIESASCSWVTTEGMSVAGSGMSGISFISTLRVSRLVLEMASGRSPGSRTPSILKAKRPYLAPYRFP